MARFDQTIKTAALENERCRWWLTIPGIGMLTASALNSAVGDTPQFANAREMAAWLGLVP